MTAYRDFTPEEIVAFKAEAATKFQGRVLGVRLEEPIAETFVVAPFDRAAYQTYWHAKRADAQAAAATVYATRTIYPSLVECARISGEWAIAPAMLAERIEGEAAGVGGLCSVALFTAPPAPPEGLDAAALAKVTAAQQEMLPPRLTPDDARALVAKHRGVRMWLVQDRTYQVILRTPDPQQWIAANAQHDAAMRRNAGVVDAVDPFVLGVVAWSSEPLTGGAGLLDRHPVIIWDLWKCYERTGGEGAASRTFRL